MERVHEIFTKAEIFNDCQTCYMYVVCQCVFFSLKQFSILQKGSDHPCCWSDLESCLLKSLNLQVPYRRRVWQSLCEKITKREKEKVEGRLWSEASGLCPQSQEASVRFMKRHDERWGTWSCPETPHFSQDKRGSASPHDAHALVAKDVGRMMNRWGVKEDRRGLWLFIKESDNKIKNNVYRGVVEALTAARRHRGEISRNCTLSELTRQSRSDTFLRANLSGQRTIRGCLYVWELTLWETRQIIQLTLCCIQHLSKPFQPAGLTSEVYKGLEMQLNAKKGTLL